jgi:hypothetical protein
MARIITLISNLPWFVWLYLAAILFGMIIIIPFDSPKEVKDEVQYFSTEQLSEFTGYIFLEGYTLGLKHSLTAKDSVAVESIEKETKEKLITIQELLK